MCRPADSYHTCYVLAGLSNVQTQHSNTSSKNKPENKPSTAEKATATKQKTTTRKNFTSAFSWDYVHVPVPITPSKPPKQSPSSSPSVSTEQEPNPIVYNEEDRLTAIHPLFVIPHNAAENMRAWSEARQFL